MTDKKSKQTKAEQIKNSEKKSAENFWRNDRREKRLFKKQKRKTSFKRVVPLKKERLSKQGRRTKWAPVWAVLKKFGPGKRIHPSAITKFKRSWRRGKLDIGPKKIRSRHYG